MAQSSDKHPPTEHQPTDHPDKMPMGQEPAPPNAAQTLIDHQAVERYSPPFAQTDHSALHAPHKADLAPQHEGTRPQEHHHATPAPAPQTPADGGTSEPSVPFDAGPPELWQARAHPAHTGADGGPPTNAAPPAGTGQSGLDQIQSQIGIDNSQPFTVPSAEPPGAPGYGESRAAPAHKLTPSAEHDRDAQPAANDAFNLKAPMTGTLPGLDFGGTYQQPGDGPSHGHLPGLDFGGQNPTDPPNLDLAPGPDHLGTFDHAADMGPPPAIA